MPTLSTKPNRFYPSIPTVSRDVQSHQNALQIITESIETHERRNSNYLKSFIRFEELVTLGIIDESGEFVLDISGGGGGIEEAPNDGNLYARQNETWASFTPGISQATGDSLYLRLDVSNDPLTSTLEINTGDLVLDNTRAVFWDNVGGTPIELLDFDAGVTGDPQWSEVQLLAKFEGTDAATTYTEVSVNAASATFNGNAQLDTAQFNFGSASLLLDGTGDYVTFPDIAAYDLGTNDWTIEGFVRFNTLPPLQASTGPGYMFFDMQNGGTELIQYAVIQDSFGYRVRLSGNGWAEVGTIVGGVSTGTWYHWAMTRTGGNIRAYFNGNYEVGDFGAAASDMGGPDEQLYIGSQEGVDAYHDGWLDDIRMTIGTARYTGTGTYTIPSSDFPEQGNQLETFHVGDPGYPTNIEGSEVQINGVPHDTHTGEVIGGTVLTVQVSSITNRQALPSLAETTDEVGLHDQTDGSLRRASVNSLTDGGYF